VNKNVTKQMMEEYDDQRMTDASSGILLGMLTTTHYQMLTAESGIQQGIE
jgi:hypothetical protein